MTASQHVDGDDDEIRALPPERILASPARVLAFTPRLSGAERWDRLARIDPRSAEMIRTLFETMYAFHFPDE